MIKFYVYLEYCILFYIGEKKKEREFSFLFFRNLLYILRKSEIKNFYKENFKNTKVFKNGLVNIFNGKKNETLK